MSATDALKPLKDEQARASRPRAHVWLGASAGTGKTHVLTARVLRLLLAGVPPERILCLTFTKKGAAEMAERVHSTLARWVQVKAADLRKDLFALGEDNSDGAIARARLLFAKVLDATGGGLRIQTIHSFCQALLAAFPVEADLVPGFRPLDGRQEAELSRSALIAMIEVAERSGDAALLDAIEMLALRLGEDGAIAYLGSCAKAGVALDALPEDIAPFLLQFLNLPTGDVDAYIRDKCSDTEFPPADLQRLAVANRAWASNTGNAAADCIAQWLAAGTEARGALVEPLCKALVTAKGTVHSKYGAKLSELDPGYIPLAEALGAQLRALIDLPCHVAFAQAAAKGLHAGRAYARAYDHAKRLAGRVDFDDLISRASRLLATDGISEWIRFKLDQRIDHILVDEAQDTNERQWDLVDAIIEDYFEADPDEGQGIRRTLFVVGDTKQAIFGFQGTSPEAFHAALRRFRTKAERTGHVIDELPLALSFRSMPAVLDVVDATIAQIGHTQIGLERAPERHASARQHPGRVLLLPPTVTKPPLDEDDAAPAPASDDADPAGEEDWMADHHRLHAERIAAQVKAWLDPAAPLWLHSKGRYATPGDVLILLRSRGDLARLIVARLYEAGVPVAGVDRLRLQAPLAVRDLLAALRFAVQPEDDLNLANLLVSPLIGWSQDDLLARAPREKGRGLWGHLRETLDISAQAPLRALLSAADFTTPYRYLEAILSGELDGRRKLVARLGSEARDAIDELLNAALGFEADDHPSLQRFIDWFDRGDADIKRELAEGGDRVRVMTVHGAKGLEAPIVIMADAASNPDKMSGRGELSLKLTDKVSVPLLMPSATRREDCPPLAKFVADAKRIEREEHWRLLYVAMTRAEELLVVSGALGAQAKGVPKEASWHHVVRLAMQEMGAQPATLAPWGEALEWRGPEGLADAKPVKASAASTGGLPAMLPLWLRAPAPVEARPPRPLAPSAAPEDDVSNPPPDALMRKAAERGRLLHALFERLPDVAPADREAAAQRWLAGPGQLADADERAAIIGHALAVIDDPAHAALFSPEALAEAPIAAVVGEQVIAGTVDRLLVTDTAVHVVDFKTGRGVPAGADQVAPAHLRQMAAYAAALAIIFPDRAIRASLLYTSGPRLIDLPPAFLEAYKPGFVATQEKLSAPDLETGSRVD